MKYFLLMLLAIIAVVACKKSPPSNSELLIYNASYSITALTAQWNGINITNTALSAGQSTGSPDMPYQLVPAGTNNLVLKSGTATLINKNIYTGNSNGYSMLVYDTGSVAATPAILILTDILTLPDTALVNIRFLDCSPDSLNVDVWLVNSNNLDSALLDSAAAYIGPTASAASVQGFSTFGYHNGSEYTVNIKRSGTGETLASVANYPFKEKGVYSIIYSGLSGGTGNNAPKLSVLLNASP